MELQYQNIINKRILPYIVYFLSFSLMLGTAVFSIGIAVFVSLWLVSGEYKAKFNIIISSPAVIAPLLLFGLISLGLLYGESSLTQRLPIYFKYQKLLYIPLIISVIRTDEQRNNALNAFLIGAIIVMVASYMKILISNPTGAEGYIVTRGHIAHNVMLSFAAFIMLRKAHKFDGSYRSIWLGLAILSIGNVFFVVTGLTGRLTMMMLLALYGWQQWKWNSIKYVALVAIVFFMVFKYSSFYEGSRLAQIHHEAADPNGSSGIRMVWYRNTLQIIEVHPLVGVGTGAFRNVYRHEFEAQKNFYATANPHNQYLLFFAELGVFGLIAFIGMLISQWKMASALVFSDKLLMHGLLITFAVGCLMNSLLLDAGEGRFFVTLVSVLLSGAVAKKVVS